MLANILIDAEDQKYYQTAQNLRLAASSLEVDSATLQLVGRAIRSKTTDHASLKETWKYFRVMVQEGQPAALYYQGLLYAARGMDNHALQLYENSIQRDWHAYRDMSRVEDVKIQGGDIWTRISALRAKYRNQKSAKEAMIKAAIDYDDPNACFYLAHNFLGPLQENYEFYLSKAAASGHGRAAHELGMFYYRQSQALIPLTPRRRPVGTIFNAKLESAEKLPSSVVKDKQRLAQEWFAISAEAKILSSMIHLAVLVRGVGYAGLGMTWLRQAQALDKVGEWSKTLEVLIAQWKTDIDFREYDMEKLSQPKRRRWS